MVIKRQSYYSMTDVKSEVMFRTPNNISQYTLSTCTLRKWRNAEIQIKLFSHAKVIVEFITFWVFLHCVRIALQRRCQVYLAEHDTQVSEVKQLIKYLTVLTEGSDKTSKIYCF